MKRIIWQQIDGPSAQHGLASLEEPLQKILASAPAHTVSYQTIPTTRFCSPLPSTRQSSSRPVDVEDLLSAAQTGYDSQIMSYSIQRAGAALLVAVAVALALCPGCGGESPSPGELTIQLHATPPPDDEWLSPLRDPSVISFELRDSQTDEVFGRSLVLPAENGGVTPSPPGGRSIDLGRIAPWGTKDLKFLALGPSGQMLGQALSKNVIWNPGESSTALLELRRPLFLLGGGLKLVAPFSPPDPIFAPGRVLTDALQDESLLRVFDQNLVSPLLPAYDLKLDAPVLAVAGTHDGLNILVVSSSGRLHVIDTLRMTVAFQTQLANGSLLPQQFEISKDDSNAVLTLYDPHNRNSDSAVIFISDLYNLRKSTKLTGKERILTFKSNTVPGPPISITYAPDGLVDTLFSTPPIRDGEPDCALLGVGAETLLNRYDPTTGMLVHSEMIPYTTGLTYSYDKERILVQPCNSVSGSVRLGQVIVERSTGPLVLPAPGVTNVLLSGRTINVLGRDNSSSAPILEARGAVRKLLSGATAWTSSLYSLPSYPIPYRITLSSDGKPYRSSIDINIAASDLLVYKSTIAPDGVRAFALTKTEHKVRGLFLTHIGSSNQYRCYIDYNAYVYGFVLINLQSGLPELIMPVGMRTIDCATRVYDSANAYIGTCLPACDPTDSRPYLKNFQRGYIPSGVDPIFGH